MSPTQPTPHDHALPHETLEEKAARLQQATGGSGLEVSMSVTGATIYIKYQGIILDLPYEVAVGELLPELTAARAYRETPVEPWSKKRRS